MKTGEEVQLDPLVVEELFSNRVHQADVVLDLYKMIYGDRWDLIEKLNGWPVCNDSTWKALFEMFAEFDKQHHPKVMAGGLWFNNGFTTGGPGAEDLKKWEVLPCEDWEHI